MAERSPQAVLDVLARHQQLHGCLYRGRVETLPARRSRRLMLLSEVAQVFEPGIRYPEAVVNDLLRVIHPDYAALRRYLIDEDFLDRADGQYWRTGGPVEPSA
jgi:hypothetical protein